MNYQINDIIEGTIINIRPFGAIMIFDDESLGLLHISEIANTFIRNIHRYLKIGKTYQVKIIDIESDGFLKVSMSKISEEEKALFRNSQVKRSPVDPKYIDFTALKEKLPEWINLAQEEMKHDQSK